jgi:hypothetical protein
LEGYKTIAGSDPQAAHLCFRAAELQKSNDLRSWRRLGDVPEEAAEVLVTPRESGNEFYRLKKK